MMELKRYQQRGAGRPARLSRPRPRGRSGEGVDHRHLGGRAARPGAGPRPQLRALRLLGGHGGGALRLHPPAHGRRQDAAGGRDHPALAPPSWATSGPLVLWFAPTKIIVAQTVEALTKRGASPARAAARGVRGPGAGASTSRARSRRSRRRTSPRDCCIVVSTLAAFNVRDTVGPARLCAQRGDGAALRGRGHRRGSRWSRTRRPRATTC